MRIGGPLFEKVMTPESLVDAHRRCGYSAAYLPLVQEAALQREMVAALDEAGIVIAEVGAYCINVLDAEPRLRQANIAAICDRLAMADEFGVLCCVMHGGTIQTGGWGGIDPRNIGRQAFDDTVTALQQIVDTVRPGRSKLVLEMSSWLLPHSPEAYLELLLAADRMQLGVHLDPVNILDSPVACYENGQIIRRCFDLLGARLVSAHSKDVLLKNAYLPIEITETYTGNGMVDYDAYLGELARLEHEPPLMLEHLQAHELDPAMGFLLARAQQLGISVRGSEHRAGKERQ
jgi:sugar phosphate isomerase/epimerase